MSKKLKITIGILSFIIFALFVWFLKDDIFSGQDTLNLISWIKDDGAYNLDGIFSACFSQIFGTYIPLIFHINPHIYSMTVGAVVRSFDVVLLCLTMSLFAFNGRKKGFSAIIFILFSMFYFCYASSNIDFSCINIHHLPKYDIFGSFILLTEYSQHFGQLVNLILGLFTLYIITSNFSQNKLPDKKYLIPLSILGFFVGTSSMFVNLSVGMALLGTNIYLAILNKNKDKKELFEQGKIVYIPTLCFIIGFICFAIYPSFFNYFTTNFDFITTLKTIFQTVVINNIFEVALIIILSASLYLLALHKSTYIKRTIFITYTTLFGTFIYYFLFNQTGVNMSTALTESTILERLLMISLIYLLYGACLREHTSEPKELKILTTLFFGVLLAFMFVQVPMTISTMTLWKNACKETKVTTYCLEKIYRFYSLKGQTALLPDDSLLKVFKISPYITDTNIQNNEEITGDVFFKHTPFTDYYYSKFYKNPNIVAYKFINSKKAMKIFFEEGGLIDANEIKNFDFRNLQDDNFVLYRAKEKTKYDI